MNKMSPELIAFALGIHSGAMICIVLLIAKYVSTH